MSISKMLQKIVVLAQKRPLLFNSVIYGSFYTGAEFAQQSYTNIFKLQRPTSEKLKTFSNTSGTNESFYGWVKGMSPAVGLQDENSLGNYNWAQLKRYAIYGCFLAGPVLHGWYKWLDAFYKGKTIKIVLSKLFADQFVLTPPLITMFFVSMSIMEGRADIFNECKIKFLSTFKTSCMYWLPIQFFNFLLIPPALRVSFVSIAAFCWVNILCYMKSIPLSECEQTKTSY